MNRGILSRCLCWYVRRGLSDSHRGRLMFVEQDGKVVDLGEFRRDDFANIVWGVSVGYRLTRDRGEKTRLGRVKTTLMRVIAPLR